VRQAHFAAVAAWHQVPGCQSIVGAAAITAAAGEFSFWLWGHGLLPAFS